MLGKIIQFNSFVNESGTLVVAEGEKDIPFDIKRIFYIYGCDKNSERGNHANLNSQFVLICLNGSVKVLLDDGKAKEEFILDNKAKGLYIPSNIWKKMYEFSDDAILLCLSDCKYDVNEYIYEYSKFIERR